MTKDEARGAAAWLTGTQGYDFAEPCFGEVARTWYVKYGNLRAGTMFEFDAARIYTIPASEDAPLNRPLPAEPPTLDAANEVTSASQGIVADYLDKLLYATSEKEKTMALVTLRERLLSLSCGGAA